MTLPFAVKRELLSLHDMLEMAHASGDETRIAAVEVAANKRLDEIEADLKRTEVHKSDPREYFTRLGALRNGGLW